jgi:hypothetical protein
MLSAGPGSDTPPSWLDGSNCQRFAYGVLTLFGLTCPPLRSSDLWDDRTATAVVRDPEPLDLMLCNSTAYPAIETANSLQTTQATSCPIAFDRFRRVMATIAAAMDLLVTVIKAAVITGAL